MAAAAAAAAAWVQSSSGTSVQPGYMELGVVGASCQCAGWRDAANELVS